MIFNPAHPGEVLKDYLDGMTVTEAAARLRVTRATLSRILNGRAGVTAGMSLRLSGALGTSPDFWLKMQGQYDLWHARKRTPKVRRFPHGADRQAAQKLNKVRSPRASS
jgi:addiction module HigA family antidote